jgi:hypothetical protein
VRARLHDTGPVRPRMTAEDQILAAEILLSSGLTEEEAAPRLKACFLAGWTVEDIEAWAALAAGSYCPSRFLRDCLDNGYRPNPALKTGCGLAQEINR